MRPPINSTNFLEIVKSEPIPAVFSGSGAVRLREALKDRAELVGGNTDPRIRDRETQCARLQAAGFAPHQDGQFSPLGELNGIAQQVENDLPQPDGIADQQRWHARHYAAAQLQFLRRERGPQ